jgi:hypothetical protein
MEAKKVLFTDNSYHQEADPEIKFFRLSEKYPRLKVIGQPLDWEVVMQAHHKRQLGMGYLACVLKEVARKKPELIERMFVTENNGSGFHLLRVMANGIERELPLDDLLPHKDGSLLLTTPKDQLWPAILEKAWTKLHGGEKNANGRSPEAPLQELFGI